MGPRTDRNAVVAGVAVHVAAALVAVPTFGLASPVTPFLAVPGGTVTGLLTDRYGSETRNGAVAGGLALALVAVAAAVYGLWLSVAMGYGFDSVVSFLYGAYAVAVLLFFLPIALAEGALAAVVGNAVRRRASSR